MRPKRRARAANVDRGDRGAGDADGAQRHPLALHRPLRPRGERPPAEGRPDDERDHGGDHGRERHDVQRSGSRGIRSSRVHTASTRPVAAGTVEPRTNGGAMGDEADRTYDAVTRELLLDEDYDVDFTPDGLLVHGRLFAFLDERRPGRRAARGALGRPARARHRRAVQRRARRAEPQLGAGQRPRALVGARPRGAHVRGRAAGRAPVVGLERELRSLLDRLDCAITPRRARCRPSRRGARP